jgi:Putative adhesin
MSRLLAVTTLVFAASALALADDTPSFEWQAEMTPGQTLTVRAVAGNIVVNLAPGTQARVTAVKTGSGDLSLLQIHQVDSYRGPMICVIYPYYQDTCQSGTINLHSNELQAQFTISLPAGVLLDASDVNGDIRVNGIAAPLTLSTVNGRLDLAGIGALRGSTVNGSITATYDALDWTGKSSLSTVNGSIDVTLPATASASIHAITVSGSVSSDFPLQVQGLGLFCSRGGVLKGTLGSGGRDLSFSTVNGSVHIRKAQ